jgi:hypothetical protein
MQVVRMALGVVQVDQTLTVCHNDVPVLLEIAVAGSDWGLERFGI